MAELQRFNPEQVSKIMSADGKVLKELYIHKRDVVNISQIPQHLRHGLIAMEDRNFFEHSGVSFQSLARAIVVNIMTLSRKQGASTITMQVARNFFLTRKKTYVRKFNEILLALKIDRTLSKDKILELYLNKIYFGKRAYGIAAAADVYYGKKLNFQNQKQ